MSSFAGSSSAAQFQKEGNQVRDTYYSTLGNDPRYYESQQQSTAGKKTLKHTATTYDFLQDHSQQVGPQVRPELASIRFTERSTNIFEPKKYENDEKILSGAPKANYTALNFFEQSAEDDSTQKPNYVS